MFTARALLEGKWPILTTLALTVATLIWCPVRWAWLPPVVLLVFTISFFRDPERRIPADANLIIAPGDGKIVEISTVNEPHFLKGEAKMVAIFLSVFNVHVQRAPVAGAIKLVKYNPGKFLDARHPKASAENENCVIGIETADGYRVAVRQIAGLIARRIVGWSAEGATLQKGERYGMIRFGSRVELFLPVDAQIAVQVGEDAKGGETIIARRK